MNLFSAAAIVSFGIIIAWAFGPSRYEIVTLGSYGEYSMLLDRRDGRIWRRRGVGLPGDHGDNLAWFEMPRLDAPRDFHVASRDRWLTGYRNQVHWRYEDAKRRREQIASQREAIEKQLQASEERDFQAEFKRRLELAKQVTPNPDEVPPTSSKLPPFPKEFALPELTPEEHARAFPSGETRQLRWKLSENNSQMEAALIDENKF